LLNVPSSQMYKHQCKVYRTYHSAPLNEISTLQNKNALKD